MHLVEEQRSGRELGDDAEGQPQPHAVAVGPQRRVGEVLELGERAARRDSARAPARGAEPADQRRGVGVLAPGQLGVERMRRG